MVLTYFPFLQHLVGDRFSIFILEIAHRSVQRLQLKSINRKVWRQNGESFQPELVYYAKDFESFVKAGIPVKAQHYKRYFKNLHP